MKRDGVDNGTPVVPIRRSKKQQSINSRCGLYKSPNAFEKSEPLVVSLRGIENNHMLNVQRPNGCTQIPHYVNTQKMTNQFAACGEAFYLLQQED